MNKNNIIKISLITALSISAYAADNHVELSFVQSSGNTESTTFSGKVQTAINLTAVDIVKAKATVLYSKADGDTDANKYTLELDYNRMLNKNLYTFLSADYVNDEFSDYDYRINIGPGLGYKILDNDIHKLDAQLAAVYAFDKFEDSSKEEYVAAKPEVNYRYNIQSNIQFNQMVNYLQSLKDSGTYFAASESSLSLKVMENLSMALTYRLDYTNETSEDKWDKKFLTSVIYDF